MKNSPAANINNNSISGLHNMIVRYQNRKVDGRNEKS